MSQTDEAARTFGLRVLPGGTDLAARVSLDFQQRLFRRNYRWPVLVSAALAADADDLTRWLTSGAARLLGCDVTARALNRIASEAAEPLFAHAVISGGSPKTEQEIRDGVADACDAADCTFLAGPETNTWDRKVTIAVSATGVVDRRRMMSRRRFEPGDAVLAVGSDRLWPPLVEAARQSLARPQAAARLVKLTLDPATALVRPAPVLAGHLQTVLRRYTVKRVVHAMLPVEGDGLAAAVERLVGPRFDVKRGRARRCCSDLLALLDRLDLEADSADEGHRLGIGYLMVVSRPFADAIARRLRRLGAAAYPFGRLVARKES